MSNYNNEKYLAEAIESVCNQTYKNWELIIIDDGSTDNSLKVIKPYLNNKKIIFFQNKKNRGIIYTQKRLINEASGEIIGILDSDDALTEDALEIMVDSYIRHPDYGLIYSQFTYCNSKLKPKVEGFCRAIPPNETNLHSDCVSHFKTFKIREYFKTQGYDEDISCAEDKDIVFKLEEVTKLLFVDKILYKHRVFPKSYSKNPYMSLLCRTSFILIMYKAYKRRINTSIPNLSPKKMVRYLLEGAIIFIKIRQIRNFFRFIISAIETHPLEFIKSIFWDVIWERTIYKFLLKLKQT